MHNNYQQDFTTGKTLNKAEFPVPELAVIKHPLIRFQEKRECYVWVHPDEICFVISADHYVKSLIKCGTQKKWMIRHCTIKEIHTSLTSECFIRLNKFYLLNRNYFSGIDEKEKLIYLNDGYSIPVPHRISKYILEIIKA